MTKEEKLKDFYQKFVALSESNLLSSTIAFQEIACASLLGHELNEPTLCSETMYEFLLIWNMIYREYKQQGLSDKIIKALASIDKNGYLEILNLYSDENFRDKVNLISEMAKDEKNIKTLIMRKMQPEMTSSFQVLSEIRESIRTNENEVLSAIQMFILASGYFHSEALDLDRQKVYEMIIHQTLDTIMNRNSVANPNEKESKEARFVESISQVRIQPKVSLMKNKTKSTLIEEILRFKKEQKEESNSFIPYRKK